MPDLLWTIGEEPAIGTVLLTHGSGTPMDAPFMERITEALVGAGFRVARFEFAYMAGRRTTAKRPPPPKAQTLLPEYLAHIEALLAAPQAAGPLLIAGKSLGGRVAAMAATTPLDPRIRGVVCFGYPFHPPAKLDDWRLAPLNDGLLPVLIAQGERDEFGHRAEVEAQTLPASVNITWLEDGSHDFGPRGASPATLKGNIAAAAAAVAAWVGTLQPATS